MTAGHKAAMQRVKGLTVEAARTIKRDIAPDISFRHWSRNMRSWFTDSLTPALTHVTEGAD